MASRRDCLALTGAAWAASSAWAQQPRGEPSAALRRAMQRALELREQAVRAGDQPYGAVVLRGEQIVGEGPSRVVTNIDPTAHAEIEALRDAARRLASRDLGGCLLVSTSRPCRMCEAAAGWAGIARMVHGEGFSDAGPPR